MLETGRLESLSPFGVAAIEVTASWRMGKQEQEKGVSVSI